MDNSEIHIRAKAKMNRKLSIYITSILLQYLLIILIGLLLYNIKNGAEGWQKMLILLFVGGFVISPIYVLSNLLLFVNIKSKKYLVFAFPTLALYIFTLIAPESTPIIDDSITTTLLLSQITVSLIGLLIYSLKTR